MSQTVHERLVEFRDGCGRMLDFDMIGIPLLYTQVVVLFVLELSHRRQRPPSHFVRIGVRRASGRKDASTRLVGELQRVWLESRFDALGWRDESRTTMIA